METIAQKIMYDIGIGLVSNAAYSVGATLIATQIPPIFWELVRDAFIIITH